jgi:hypothetical protein
VAERDPTLVQRHEPGGLGGLERAAAERRRRGAHGRHGRADPGGGDEERAARRLVEAVEATGEGALDPVGDRERLLERLVALELRGSQE